MYESGRPRLKTTRWHGNDGRQSTLIVNVSTRHCLPLHHTSPHPLSPSISLSPPSPLPPSPFSLPLLLTPPASSLPLPLLPLPPSPSLPLPSSLHSLPLPYFPFLHHSLQLPPPHYIKLVKYLLYITINTTSFYTFCMEFSGVT